MRIPKYRHNGDGRAFIQYRNRRIYLGRYGTPESERRYRAFVASLFQEPTEVVAGQEVTVAMVVDRYLRHAETYYSRDGAPSGEFVNVRNAVGDFLALFAAVPVTGLGPKHLLALQRELVKAGYARTSINSRVGRVKRCLRWATANELIPRGVIEGLWTVDGLREGRTMAVEPEPIKPIAMAHVRTTTRYTSPTVAAMIEVQYLCGMRPDEVCQMRACDLDMSREIWLYRPSSHKNKWRKQALIKAVPPQAQAIIRPFLSRDLSAYLFSPRDSVLFWAQSVPRRCKVYPYEQRKRSRSKVKKQPDRYTTSTYGKAIGYAIKRANAAGENVPHWTPNQLRHSIATQISGTLGLQAAQRWLGHAKIDTTGLYVEVQAAELVEIAGRISAAGG